MMTPKFSGLNILANRCPVCHQGHFFLVESAFDLRKFDQMHAHCPVCGQNFEPEPGFYTGSLYISYGLYVAWTLSNFLVFVLLFGMDVMDFMWILIGTNLVLTPYFFRLARRIWFTIFTSTR